jgi:hypothetical protein
MVMSLILDNLPQARGTYNNGPYKVTGTISNAPAFPMKVGLLERNTMRCIRTIRTNTNSYTFLYIKGAPQEYVVIAIDSTYQKNAAVADVPGLVLA